MIRRSDIVNNVTEKVQNSLEQRKKHALFYKCAAAWGLNRPFHGRPQPSNLDDVFSQAQRLVQEVHRILNDRGPSEGDVEYCTDCQIRDSPSELRSPTRCTPK